jgi:hypothetical protein
MEVVNMTLGTRAPSTHWIGDRVDPRVGLDAVAKRKIPSPFRDPNHGGAMKHSRSWEANSHWAKQKFPTFYGTRRYKSLSLVPNLSQMHPVHTFPLDFTKIHSDIIFPYASSFSEWSLPLSCKIFVCVFHVSHACYMHPSHHPWFDRCNNVWRSVQVMKLLIMQSSSASHHFLPLRSKYSPQHPVLKHP